MRVWLILLVIAAFLPSCSTTPHGFAELGGASAAPPAKQIIGGSTTGHAYDARAFHHTATPHDRSRSVCFKAACEDECFGHDALGSVVLRVGPTGTPARTAYDAWGAVRATPATGPPLGATGDRVGFTGHSNEPTGLVYAQQRWLDPTTGRFLSLDPYPGELDVPLSTQGFTYLQGNPTSGVDPDGRCGPWGAAIGGAVGGLIGAASAYHQGGSVSEGAALGAASGAGVGLTCGIGAALAAGAGLGGAAAVATSLGTAESGRQVLADGAVGVAVGTVSGLVGVGAGRVVTSGSGVLSQSLSATGKEIVRTSSEFGSGTLTSAGMQYATGDGTVDWTQAAIDGAGAAAGYGAGRVGHRATKGQVSRRGSSEPFDSPSDGLDDLRFSGRAPRGVSEAVFMDASATIRDTLGPLGADVVVQGSRAVGAPREQGVFVDPDIGASLKRSDIDFGVRVDAATFNASVAARFGTPVPGSAKWRTMQHAVETGKIQAGEMGWRGLRRNLETKLGMEVDISLIRKDGPFDTARRIPIAK